MCFCQRRSVRRCRHFRREQCRMIRLATPKTWFYAALLAVCAAHEFLCFEWGQGSSKICPVGSAVMVRSHQAWAALLSDLSNVAIDKCKSIISDLSFDFDKSLDLHVNPFIPLGTGGALAVAPQFPLHSQCDTRCTPGLPAIPARIAAPALAPACA